MGSKWTNFKQVFTWSGVPEGDGLEWRVREGCDQYSLTVSSFVPKASSFLAVTVLAPPACRAAPSL